MSQQGFGQVQIFAMRGSLDLLTGAGATLGSLFFKTLKTGS